MAEYWHQPGGARGVARPATLWLAKGFVVFTVIACATSIQAKDILVFFGTYTNALSKGIYVSHLDSETGNLSAPELAAETPSPCFLAVSPDKKFLYAANSVSTFNDERAGAVSAFAVDTRSGKLTLLNQKSSTGTGPCHLSVDATEKTLLIANYNNGTVKSYSLNTDGSLGADGSYITHHGSSINTSRQSAPHAHFICADPSNRYALTCDLGMDKVMIYRLAAADGTLENHSFGVVPPGSGARHLAFSADGRFAYVVNEMACTVTTFAWDPAAGTLAARETVSVLPADVPSQPSYTAAEVRVAGNHVYATIRGHDSVSMLTADSKTGELTFVQNVPAGGKIPRGLGVDPTGHWLIVGNQKTDNAVEFAVDPQTGKLSATGHELKIGAPVDVEFVPAN